MSNKKTPAGSVREAIRYLTQAQNTLRPYLETRQLFERFLDFSLATLSGWRIEAGWEMLQQHKDEVSTLDYHLGSLQYIKMLKDWHLVLEGLDNTVIEEFAATLSILIKQAASDYTDLIGQVYMELGQASRWKGQFFTPPHIARLMAEVTLVDIENWPPDRPLKILEPCCGSGIMFLAAAEKIAQGNSALLKNGMVEFFGIDIDPICVKMCRLNLMLHGLDSSTARLYRELSRAEQRAIEEKTGRAVSELVKAIENMRQGVLPGFEQAS